MKNIVSLIFCSTVLLTGINPSYAFSKSSSTSDGGRSLIAGRAMAAGGGLCRGKLRGPYSNFTAKMLTASDHDPVLMIILDIPTDDSAGSDVKMASINGRRILREEDGPNGYDYWWVTKKLAVTSYQFNRGGRVYKLKRGDRFKAVISYQSGERDGKTETIGCTIP
jgi:hypothetical protein